MRLSFLALCHVMCDFSRAATFIEKNTKLLVLLLCTSKPIDRLNEGGNVEATTGSGKKRARR